MVILLSIIIQVTAKATITCSHFYRFICGVEQLKVLSENFQVITTMVVQIIQAIIHIKYIVVTMEVAEHMFLQVKFIH